MKGINIIGLLFTILVFSSCEKYFGDKTDVSFIEEPEYQNRTIAYVPIQPVLDKFVKPVDVIAGFDQLIYVADAGAQEIVSMDASGKELGRFSIPGLKTVVQDRRLDLLAIGTSDTIIQNVQYSLSAIYRINLKGLTYGLKGASITKKIVHPFYLPATGFSAGQAEATLNSIAVMHDNSYYVTRSGPRNTLSQTGGPDDAVLVFNAQDNFVTPVSVSTTVGLFSDYFKKPVGITTLVQPPQSFGITTRRDFIFSSVSESNALKVQYISFFETENGSSYEVKQLTEGDYSQADGFLYTPYKFNSPVDVTYTGDGTNYIFVVDSQKDSLYQFTNTGLEGIKPPAASVSKKNVKASFGGRGTQLTQFNNPMGVAYINKIVYVADAGNHRVLRFKLTTDFQ